MYRTSSVRREIGMRSGRYTGGAVLVPWSAIDLRTRRRLLAARPIAAESRRAQTFAMFAIACACGFALVMLSGRGWGQVDHAWLVERTWLVVPYALLLAGVAVPSAGLARRVLSGGAWFPYERALLQLDALERTPKGLVVRPFGDAREAIIDDDLVELRYADGSTFRIRTTTAAAVMDVVLRHAEDALARASLSDDRTERDAIDPLTTLRDDRGFAVRAAAKKLAATPPSRDRTPALAAVITLTAFAGAQPVLSLRNRQSDDAGFAYALAKKDITFYEAYLTNGARHAREVHDELLPRALLDDAKLHDDPDAIGKMLARFPGSRFDAEARGALGSMCVVVGEGYTTPSVTNLFEALARFATEHPACTPYVDKISSRFFDAKRADLRKNDELEPALRDMILDLLDRAEHKRMRVPFVIIVEPIAGHELGKQTLWTLDESMRRFLGPAIDPLVHEYATDADRLQITLSTTPPCPRGLAAPGVVAHFELHDGATHAKWTRDMEDEFEIFEAATTKHSATLHCAAIPQPTLSP